MKSPASEDQTFSCGACGASYYVESNLAAHDCQRVVPRPGAFHAAHVVTDTGPTWLGRPVPGTQWRSDAAV